MRATESCKHMTQHKLGTSVPVAGDSSPKCSNIYYMQTLEVWFHSSAEGINIMPLVCSPCKSRIAYDARCLNKYQDDARSQDRLEMPGEPSGSKLPAVIVRLCTPLTMIRNKT